MFKPDQIRRLENIAGANEGTVDLYNDTRARKILDKVNPNTKTYKRTAKAIQEASDAFDNEDTEAFNKMVAEVAQMEHNSTSHKVMTRRIQYTTLWVAMVRNIEPDTTIENAWIYETVKRHLKKFLIYVVETSKPQKGYTHIRSTTLMQAFHNLCALVIQFTHEPVSLRKRGFQLLSAEGFFTQLEDELLFLIRKYKLDRTRRTPFFLGRDALFIIFMIMLADSEHSGLNRMTVMQSFLRFLLTFYATCRPSTLGYTEKKWQEAGEYPTLGNVRIYRRGYMKYEIVFRFTSYKNAINTVEANEQTFTLGGVEFAHNAIFDITVALLAYLFMRGVFLKKYQNPQDLFDDESAEILIDPAYKDSPLFLATKPGGKGFTDEPASSLSATQSLEYWCTRVGFPKMGMTAIRRETGNLYGQMMGLDMARTIMNHHHEGFDVFRMHYSRATDNYNLVGPRVGEVAGPQESRPGEVIERDRERHAFREFAVEWMVHGYDQSNLKTARREKQVASRDQVTLVDVDLDVGFVII